jgi:hypothetical protein
MDMFWLLPLILLIVGFLWGTVWLMRKTGNA